MKKEIYICDICNKEIEESQFRYTITKGNIDNYLDRGISHDLDICDKCMAYIISKIVEDGNGVI